MIENDYYWTNIFLLAVGTLAIRNSVIALSSKIQISDRQREIFTFIPAAILPALAVPMVFYHQGTQTLLFGKERFVILLLATGVAYYTKKMTATLLFGLLALYLVTQL